MAHSPETLTLGLEFSSAQRSVAVVAGDRVLSVAMQPGGRPTRTIGLIDEALAQAGIGRERIERVAVGIGPGSHTGIRMAISTAQGWHLASGCRVAAVGSFAALAAALGVESEGPWLLAADAQRKEFAVAMAVDGRLAAELLRLIGTDVLSLRIVAGERTAGTDPASVGCGALPRFPEASWVARMANAEGGRFDVAPEAMAPVYLRQAAFVKAPAARIIPGISDGLG